MTYIKHTHDFPFNFYDMKYLTYNHPSHTGFPPKTSSCDLLVLTVGTYSEGNLLVVYEMRRQVLPTAPSPTTTHLMVCIVKGYLCCTSICNRTKNTTNYFSYKSALKHDKKKLYLGYSGSAWNHNYLNCACKWHYWPLHTHPTLSLVKCNVQGMQSKHPCI